MKKITIVFVVLGVLTLGAYLFARFALKSPGFKPAQAADTSFQTKSKETILDLRPKLISRLQELVSKGSNGLYKLHIAEANPDVLSSTITLKNVSLEPDMAALSAMSRSEKENCDVFKFKSDSMHITGIGVQDIFSKDIIDLEKVFINAPVIDIIQRSSDNGKDKLSLYECLLGNLKRLTAKEIVVNNGAVINHTAKTDKPATFRNLYAKLSDLQIDSTTQHDKNRFLFSKQATLSLKNYVTADKDGFYDYSIGEISITTADRLLRASNIRVQPRFNKKTFAKQAGMAKERYELNLSSVQLKNVDWWSLASDESLVADEATLNGGVLDVYLNRSLPQKISKVGNYPHQLMMKIPMKVNIRKVNISDVRFDYAEFNPNSGKHGSIVIQNMNGTIKNLTNIPSVIKSNPFTDINASGTFMGLSRADLSLQLNLRNIKSGNFKASLKIKGFDGKLINPVAEPIGMFSIKDGTLKGLTSTVSGNNNSASGKVIFLYDDLDIAALEKDSDKPGGLDKKDVTSFIANAFLVKKQNPAKNETRSADCSFQRDPYGSFFNLIWKTTFVGILKTTGLPEKLAYKK